MLHQGASATATALVDADKGTVVSYGELEQRVDALRAVLRKVPRPALAFMFPENSVACVTAYLACLAEKLPLGLSEPGPVIEERVCNHYQPTVLFTAAGAQAQPAGYELLHDSPGQNLRIWARQTPYPVAIHPELALMLPTSGSTGDAKFVRLTSANLAANATSIAEYLSIGTSGRAVLSLPMHYSYGLSIINSHLQAGAAVVLTRHSFMRREFWSVVDGQQCDSFAGVPYMYETLHRLRLSPTNHKSIRTMTQAGGHLNENLARAFEEKARLAGVSFFVMYGQTEATARIAYIPPDRLREKIGSIGIAIPRGRLWLEPVEGESDMNQLCYSGPNVMMGYAHTPEDLASGDLLKGILRSGDLARCDSEGFFFLKGRLSRHAKLFGKRISLTGVENEIETTFTTPAMAIEGHDKIMLYLENAADVEAVRLHMARFLGVPPLCITVLAVDKIPRTLSGKKNYRYYSQK